MKRTGILALVVLALVSVAVADLADAKRLGGGRSFGAQRQSVAPPPSPTGPAANPVMPAQPGAAMPKTATAAPAASGMSRWLAPVAGIAAGLGLAALLAHFGLPEGFASVLLLALAAVAVFALARMFLSRRAASPMPYAGAGAPGPRSAPEPVFPRAEPVVRPSPPAPSTNFAKPVPAGFDTAGFLREAKVQFRRLQAAWDAGDRRALSEVTTAEMASEIGRDLDARGAHQPTEVVSLEAELLEVTTEAGAHWASVRFTGVVREDGVQASPLDEVWNLTKPVDGSTGWLLAGIRQMA